MENINKNIISLVPPLYDNFRTLITNETESKCCVDIFNIVGRNEIGFSLTIKVNIHYAKY